MKYYVGEYSVLSEYDLMKDVVNYVTMIQLEDTYVKISNACCTFVKQIFDGKPKNDLSLTKTSPSMIF